MLHSETSTYKNPWVEKMKQFTEGSSTGITMASDESQGSLETPAGIVMDKLKAKEVLDTTYTSKTFRVHFFVALTLSTASFVIWALQAWAASGWPWFVYVWGGFIASLSAHFYLVEQPQKQWLPFHFVLFSVTNICVFMSWTFAGDYKHAWFLQVLAATALVLGVHATLSVFKTSDHKYLYTHITAYTLLNTLCFVIWMDEGKGFPWFLYAIFGLAIPLHLHWCLHFPFENTGWRIHAGLFVFAQLILFFSWATTSMNFPWFFFPLLLWGAVFGIHTAYVHRFSKTSRLPTLATEMKGVTVEPAESRERTAALRNVGVALQR